jgi:predicted glycosyltransferase
MEVSSELKLKILRMKIWFELTNSPHINLFAALIKDLMHEHEVIITCRPLANTIELLNLHGLKYTNVGKHYGGKLLSKVMGYPVRVNQLYRFLKKQRPDIAISQSSFHSPLTAKLLGIPSIYMNDNEHAVGNIPAFVFATKILIPEFLDRKKVNKQWARDSKIIQYPGVKEGIYLWNASIPACKVPEKIIYVRPEPWIAQYYKGALNFMDDMLLELKNNYKIVLLPRGKDQAKHYEQEKFKGIQVLNKPLTLEEIASNCRLFIGAGGTMTREMAVLGIPTISVYQDTLLDVDQYLIDNGMMIHEPNLTGKMAIDYLKSCEQKGANSLLLTKGKETYNLIRNLLTNKLFQ